MENLLMQFINTYGVAILYALLTAAAGLLANAVKNLYRKVADDRTKRAVARTVVMAVQQLYKELDGPDKFNMALDSMTEMLNEKGITISALEARMLIEAAVGEFKNVFLEDLYQIPEDPGEPEFDD